MLVDLGVGDWPKMQRVNWDNFEDSDDEELAGGKLERATYQVLAPQVTIYEAPDDATNKLGFRRAGERLFCDARAGNWVRLSQTFVLGKGFDRRGWVLIEGNADVGRFLKKLDSQPKPAATEPVKPAAAEPLKPTAAAQPPAKLASQPPVATDAQRTYYDKWQGIAADLDATDDDDAPPAEALAQLKQLPDNVVTALERARAACDTLDSARPPVPVDKHQVTTKLPPATEPPLTTEPPPAAELLLTAEEDEDDDDDIGEPLGEPVAFEPSRAKVVPRTHTA